MIKFISYSGSYPCLCSGTLTLEFDGDVYSIGDALSSGGGVWFTKDWDEVVEEGPWSIMEHALPDELKLHIEEISELVNDNVPYGCCGGCV